MDDIQKLRLIILGGENTGKTSLTHSILEGSILEIAHETENLDSYQNISLSDRNNYEHVHLNNTISLDMNCSINSDTKNNNNLLEHEENNNNTIINDKSDSNESKQTLYNQTTNNINNQYNNNIEVSEFNIESSSLKSSKNNSNINNNKTLSTQDSENVDKSAHLNFYSNNKDSNNNNNSDSVSGSRKKDSNTSIGSLTFNQNKNNKNNDQHQNYYSQRTIEYKLQTYKVTLYDSVFLTSASNELTGIKTISDYQGFILVFSLDDELSFETIQHINQVLTSKVGFKYVPRVLVGNKSDLPCVIDKERIKKLKKKLLCPYVECSVKEGKNLDKVLIKILKEINKEYKDEHPYDIVNSNREMNFISQDAYFWRKLLNLLFIVIMFFCFLLILFDFVSFIERIEGKWFSLISFSVSCFTCYIAYKCLCYSKKKEADKMMRMIKYIYLCSLLNLLVIIFLSLFSPKGDNLDYLTFFIYMIMIFIQINTSVITFSIFPLYITQYRLNNRSSV